MDYSRAEIHRVVDEISEHELTELADFLEFLRFKRGRSEEMAITQQGRAEAMKRLYDAFAPVREAVAASGMTEQEIDQIIDEAIDEVRSERS